MVYRLTGTLDDKAVRDAIELSQTKYCSVAAMLRKNRENYVPVRNLARD